MCLPAGPPVAVPDTFPQSLSGPTTVPGPGVLTNDTVPCGTAATIKVISNPKSGTVQMNNNGSFTYVPSGAPTADSFVYEVTCFGKVRASDHACESV